MCVVETKTRKRKSKSIKSGRETIRIGTIVSLSNNRDGFKQRERLSLSAVIKSTLSLFSVCGGRATKRHLGSKPVRQSWTEFYGTAEDKID